VNAVNHSVAARECAALFRLGQDVQGALRMVELFEAVLAAVEPQSGMLLLQAMLEAQQRQDWLALADYLEHDLPALLEQAARH